MESGNDQAVLSTAAPSSTATTLGLAAFPRPLAALTAATSPQPAAAAHSASAGSR